MKVLSKRHSAIIQSLGFNEPCDRYYCVNQVRANNSVASFKSNETMTYSSITMSKLLDDKKIKSNFMPAPAIFDAVLFLESNLGVIIDLIPITDKNGRKYKIHISFTKNINGELGDIVYDPKYSNKIEAYEYAVTSVLEISNDFKWANYL